MTEDIRDAIWAVLLGMASVAIFFYSDTFVGTVEAPALAEPSVYSKIWAVILLILSISLMARSMKKRRRNRVNPLMTKGIFLTVISLLIYLSTLKKLGFLPCTIVFLAFLMTYYNRLSSSAKGKSGGNLWKTMLRAITISTVVGLTLNFVFGSVFGVYLPAGELFQ
ncbi:MULTISPECIES: tripartite tricarboxylate transporter TctB family protein [Dethiosulfovibrio]|uniref:Tripartite tricarboxylate transporter TctB family protein n=2 Tax=Dethiosulfovibrio TaxID=47054 RepID=A0ABS9EM27_9BACT|nr:MULTISPECIES: tripartite tricarboxylate transporter TctB family protein [Dethiosulfovibrio]MCF4113188.1 tripartite tricarboxylate transporter TctB family protein [Dethiosulfovibrio russensis]MCF4142252.1 tripartite tricarboxylate transporter TctB family protein [Dethiosulfovibrio marinus]MCF4144560.1 tripartite tricarboxylate transporter TctB family protein [Dethiosulfovibrio acidaminovorans]